MFSATDDWYRQQTWLDAPGGFESEDGKQIHLREDPEHRPAARAHVAVEVDGDLASLEARLDQARVEHSAIDRDDLRVVLLPGSCRQPVGAPRYPSKLIRRAGKTRRWSTCPR
jgi:hypothetical protein